MGRGQHQRRARGHDRDRRHRRPRNRRLRALDRSHDRDDALPLLQRATCNDVSKLEDGRAHYNGLLYPTAGFVDDILIYRNSIDDYFVDVSWEGEIVRARHRDLRGVAVGDPARGGAEALAKLATFDPELILLDYQMPGMNGVELCERIVANRPDVPVVVITAFGGNSTGRLSILADIDTPEAQQLVQKAKSDPEMGALLKGILDGTDRMNEIVADYEKYLE